MKINQLKISALQIVCFLLFALFITACDDYGKKLEFKKGEVYYKDGISEDEAKKLGDALLEAGYFDDINRKSVQFIKKGENYYLRYVVDKAKLNPEVEKSFQEFDKIISEKIFSGKKIITDLCDEKLVTIKEIE